MPLFCINLLVPLLLPLTLSCDSRRPLEEVKTDYLATLHTDLDNTGATIATLLQNSSCSEKKPKFHGCTTNNPDFVSTLLNLTCKMKKMGLHQTDRLVSAVLNSIQCPCPEKPTRDPTLRRRRRRTTRQKRNGHRKRREIRKLCRAEAILSSMSECYKMLSSGH